MYNWLQLDLSCNWRLWVQFESYFCISWFMNMQPVREAVSYRGLFTAGWFGVREKQCSRLKIYDRLRANEQADDGTRSWELVWIVARLQERPNAVVTVV